MNKTCELLKKSFYNDEWELTENGARIWKRKKDGLEIWGDNGFWFFNGYRNCIHIPVFMRPIMSYHMTKSQSERACEKWLEDK